MRGHTPTVSRTVVYTMGLRVRIPLEAFLCAAMLKSTEADPRMAHLNKCANTGSLYSTSSHVHFHTVSMAFDVIRSFFSGYMFGGGTTAHRHTRTLLRTVIRAPSRMTSLLGEGDYI